MMADALAGIKVIDCTRLLPGGLCTMLLGDLGADVVKIEEPGRGDYIRTMPPFAESESYMHLVLNRNKRSVTLNLKTEAGCDVLREMVRHADIIVEGNRPGVMDRLGVGYENLSQVNPGIIYCAITGYGQDGPYANMPGHDLNYMGIAGALELFARKGETPLPPGLTVADIGGGAQMAVVGILAALHARRVLGKGQFIDISMTDGVVYWLSLFAAWQFGFGKSPRGGEHVLLGQFPCYAAYPAADGNITVGCLEPHFWANLCHALDRPQYVAEQFSMDRAPAIFEDLSAVFRTKSRAEWFAYFASKNVCVGPSYTIEEAMNDPHIQHRQMFTTVQHPTEGEIHQLGNPIKLSATPGSIRRPPPQLGEHTAEVLAQLGYDHEACEKLRAEGVL
ncbi:MAG: CaiB/BaiF CoA-transferase family protein [Candidatus Hydrogenedentales bacterium]|jgi:crotonobetainyl-CoA:carnitine CoA-transferase CaiB-like acyl-CoA transferase